MTFLKISSVALVILAGIGAASAATIQNGKGTFIQDRNGVWHEYVRVQPGVSMAPSRYNADPNMYQSPLPIDVAKGDINGE